MKFEKNWSLFRKLELYKGSIWSEPPKIISSSRIDGSEDTFWFESLDQFLIDIPIKAEKETIYKLQNEWFYNLLRMPRILEKFKFRGLTYKDC